MAVAEEEIFTDLLTEHRLNRLAGLDGIGKIMVDARIGHAEAIEQIIAALLFKEAPGRVFGAAGKYGFTYVHSHHPARMERSVTVTSF